MSPDSADGSLDNSEEEDIPASLLTPSQREYLRGENQPPNQAAERSMRSRIRKRIHAGIRNDFAILMNSERLDIDGLDLFEEHRQIVRRGGISSPAAAGLGFFFAAIENQNRWGKPRPPGWSFARNAEGGIRRGLTRLGIMAEEVVVDVTIQGKDDFGDVDVTELSELSLETLRQLAMAGEITMEQYEDAIIQRQEEDSE